MYDRCKASQATDMGMYPVINTPWGIIVSIYIIDVNTHTDMDV